MIFKARKTGRAVAQTEALIEQSEVFLQPLWNDVLLRVGGLFAKGTRRFATVRGIRGPVRYPHSGFSRGRSGSHEPP